MKLKKTSIAIEIETSVRKFYINAYEIEINTDGEKCI